MTKDEILAEIMKLGEEELNSFADAAIEKLNYLRKSKQIKSAMAFKIGDVVEFNSKKYGEKIRITIDAIRNGNLSGMQTTGSFPTKWKVAASLCKMIR